MMIGWVDMHLCSNKTCWESKWKVCWSLSVFARMSVSSIQQEYRQANSWNTVDTDKMTASKMFKLTLVTRLASGVWGDTWCNGQHVCFPSKHLPPILKCGFESQLGLEFSGLVMWYFLKLVVGDFLHPTYPPSLSPFPSSSVKSLSQQKKAKTYTISVLSNLMTYPFVLCGTQHAA